MTSILLFAGFCILAAIWTAIWGWVLLGASRSTELSQVETAAAILRRRLIYVMSAVWWSDLRCVNLLAAVCLHAAHKVWFNHQQKSGFLPSQHESDSRAAAWLYGIGGAGFILMLLLSGALSVPRRFAEHIPAWQLPDQITGGFGGLFALALLCLGSEIVFRLARAWCGN